MSENIEIRVVIDSSLVKFFAEGMRRRHIDISIQEELTEFLAMLLNDTMYPIISSKTGDDKIYLSYRPRAFADPIF
jgi:hypothetical protein